MSLNNIKSFDLETQQQIRDIVASLKLQRAGFRHADLEFSWPNAEHISKGDLKSMAGLQDLFFTHHFTSHRRWLGPWIIFAKKISVGLLNRLLKISLVRQVELNQHLWNLALTVQHLEQRVLLLEQQQREKKPGDHQ